MSALFIAVRAIHYASALVLFGELVFAIAVAPHSWHSVGRGDFPSSARVFRIMTSAIVIGAAAGALWFVLEAAAMSGMPIASALNPATLAAVVHGTSFGRAWAVRAGLLIVLLLIAIAILRSTSTARTVAMCALGAVVAGAYLGALAWAGHAAAGEGGEDNIQTFGDVVHLLAAGAWLGALPALVDALGVVRSGEVAARAARRFSAVGLAGVTALIASGLVNAWYQVGDAPALIGTLYGRLLIAKLALFAAMIVVAVINRGILSPRVVGGDRTARGALRRNALIEIALGLGVVVIVGRLGVTVPAAHESVLWPFGYTLSTIAIEQSAWMQLTVAAAAMIAFAGAIFVLAGLLRRPLRVRFAALAVIVACAALLAGLLVVPAHPTTYASSPVGYTAKAIAAGAALYASNCGACHGRDGRGDGPAASSDARPGDLAEQIQRRKGGDLFWAIAHGIAGSAMPEFGSKLSETEIWDLIEFLDAQSAARNAAAMTERVKPLLPIPAPDFTYELRGAPQQTLLGSRGDRVTLLVFYTLPESLTRLTDIAANLPSYAKAGSRVIAVALRGESVDALRAMAGADTIIAAAAADVGRAYLLFADVGGEARAAAPAHLEYLIDRQGQLRVRWIGTPENLVERGAATLREVGVLFREPLRPVPQWGHRH